MKTHGIATFAAIAGFLAACAPGEPPADYETTDDSILPAEEAAIEQPTTEVAPVLATASLEDGRMYLTDAAGRALYLFTADGQGAGESACHDACAEAWPPMTAGDGMPMADAAGLDASLLGTIERGDGTRQVTYNGWPLYYYAQDTSPGMTTGHDVQAGGGEWYLVTPEGQPLESTTS